MHGTRQDIGIASSPSGADVWIDNIQMGQTPVIEKLTRKDNHIVKIVLPGFQPFETTVTRSVSGWVWGNLAFGGLIGLGVDAISGGLYKLSPEQMTGTLLATRAGIPTDYDGVYVSVVLKAEAGWEKVGQLQRTM
jgi:PEGA domain